MKKGTERIAELETRFPHIPRSIILKADMIREKFRYTPEVGEIGQETVPQFVTFNPGSRFRDDGSTPTRSWQGWTLAPWSVRLTDGTAAIFNLAADAPYEIRKDDTGVYWLYRDGDRLEALSFPRRPEWYGKSVASGHLMANILHLTAPECLILFPLRYCEYTKKGLACRFCCLDPAVKELADLGVAQQVKLAPEDVEEAFRAAVMEGAIRHVCATGGTLWEVRQETAFYIDIFSRLRTAREALGASVPFVTALTPPADEDDYRRLRDEGGITVVGHNMDVWEPRLWPEVVPGKYRHIGIDGWKDALQRAVNVFGWGRVQSTFVLGVEVASPNGFTDLAAAGRSVVAGFEWMYEHGVLPKTSFFIGIAGAPYGDRHGAGPPTEYLLETSYELYRLHHRYGMPLQSDVYCRQCMNTSPDYDYFELLDGAGECRTASSPRGH